MQLIQIFWTRFILYAVFGSKKWFDMTETAKIEGVKKSGKVVVLLVVVVVVVLVVVVVVVVVLLVVRAGGG